MEIVCLCTPTTCVRNDPILNIHYDNFNHQHAEHFTQSPHERTQQIQEYCTAQLQANTVNESLASFAHIVVAQSRANSICVCKADGKNSSITVLHESHGHCISVKESTETQSPGKAYRLSLRRMGGSERFYSHATLPCLQQRNSKCQIPRWHWQRCLG